MKRVVIIFATVLLTVSTLFTLKVSAQTPDKMSYQAVIRNSSDALVKSATVGMQISILQGSADGTAIYIETQAPATNSNGLISIEIGGGTVVYGNFSTIDWPAGPYFLKTETDPGGGTSYSITGVSQLMSVPYALHAKTAESISGEIEETDPVFNTSVAAGISETDTANWNKTPDTVTGNESIFDGWDKDVSDDFNGRYSSLRGEPTQLGEFTNDVGFITNVDETDPEFTASIAHGINGADTAYWNSKQNDLGNHIATQNINLNGYSISNDGTNEGISISSTSGDVTTSNDLKVTGEVNRPSTGSANMIPIAYGNVASDGSVNSGSGNISTVWSSTNSRYEITISDESYSYSTYITMVTPITGGISTTTSSVSGKLLVKIFDASGNQVQGIFQFVTFKP